MTYRVIVNGARGCMGTVAVAALRAEPDFEVVAELGRDTDLAQEIQDTKADIVLDFTNAKEVFGNAKTIIAAGARPVIGTSGLRSGQIALLKVQCMQGRLGGIVVPNFSIGAVLMMQSAARIAQYLPQVEVIEMHHDQKVDSPSGTAMKTIAMIAEKRQAKPAPSIEEKQIVPGARGAVDQGIHIHSIRLPGLLAHQQVIFGSIGETLTVRHDSINRECFMPGIVLACRQVMKLEELLYGLEHVLTGN